MGRVGMFVAVAMLAAAVAVTSSCAPRKEGVVEPLLAEDRGTFVRTYWFEPGIENGNPKYNGRFRVNAPEVVLTSNFGSRVEARANGMMLIKAEEDPRTLAGARIYAEIWGGHPKTANKRLTINGRTTYEFPRVGTEDGNCTHQYPTFDLKPTDVVNGWQAIQFACDKGTSFWGHFIVDNACVEAVLRPDDAGVAAAGLGGFEAAVRATPSAGKAEQLDLSLECPAEVAGRIARVDYFGRYRGYDENGSGEEADWHGYTKRREPTAHLGSATVAPFAVAWDTSMLPDQEDVAVMAVVRFVEPANLEYRTVAAQAISLPDRAGDRVRMILSKDLPRPFWSRANREKHCTIDVDVEPSEIVRAELHVVIWDGGRGTVETPFTLNGTLLEVAGKGAHDVLYRVVPVDASILRKGANEIRVLSDTEHHGIEVLLPGPALVVRTRAGGGPG